MFFKEKTVNRSANIKLTQSVVFALSLVLLSCQLVDNRIRGQYGGSSILPVTQISSHQNGDLVCALNNFKIRCWGSQAKAMGYAQVGNVGDDETPFSMGDIVVGDDVIDLGVGGYHVCVVTKEMKVKCWGYNTSAGILGYGHTSNLGVNQYPENIGYVDIGEEVVDVESSIDNVCVLTVSGRVKCWGANANGTLGLGPSLPTTESIGDDELPSSIDFIDFGGLAVKKLSVGSWHNCVLLENNKVICWGNNSWGQLGYGHTNVVGDDEAPFSAGYVDVGGDVIDISAGNVNTCAVLATGDVRCWGDGAFGRNGNGSTTDIGDNELPSSRPIINISSKKALKVFMGQSKGCVLLDDGSVKCWGTYWGGHLGIPGLAQNIGDNEGLDSIGVIDIGFSPISVSLTAGSTCALSGEDKIRCWGTGSLGVNGYGNTNNIGDDETPASVGDAPVF